MSRENHDEHQDDDLDFFTVRVGDSEDFIALIKGKENAARYGRDHSFAGAFILRRSSFDLSEEIEEPVACEVCGATPDVPHDANAHERD